MIQKIIMKEAAVFNSDHHWEQELEQVGGQAAINDIPE